MRKILLALALVGLATLAGCVTINVYFPKAAAERAADQFIDSVIGPDAAAKPASGDAAANPSAHNPPVSGPSATPVRSAGVLDFLIPAAHAADTPNLRVHTPAVDAIHQRMRARFQKVLSPLLDQGVIGFTEDGLLAVRDASSVPLSRRAAINTAVAEDNSDRVALYREIANANGHPEWEADIRGTFARLWIQNAHAGWYYRSAKGVWKRK